MVSRMHIILIRRYVTVLAFHTAQTALLRVVHDISSDMNKQHVPILVLLDLSAAFDTVDHAILLHQVKTSLLGS